MKKLLITSALVSATFAMSAYADGGPTVKVGGMVDGRFVSVSQKKKTDIVNNTGTTSANSGAANALQRNKQAVTADSMVYIKAEGTADMGMRYGGLVEIEDNSYVINNRGTGSSSNVSTNNGFRTRRSFVYGESNMGRLELGSNYGADEMMKVDAAGIARGDGGIASQFASYIYHVGSNVGTRYSNTENLSGGDSALIENYADTGRGIYIFNPTVYTDYDGIAYGPNRGQRMRANKVTYYTPRVMGFQAGVSYTPDLDSNGSMTTAGKYYGVAANSTANGTSPISLGTRNTVSAALNYVGEFQKVGVAGSVSYARGSAKKGTLNPGTASANYQSYHNLNAWSVGAKVSYMQFAVAGSYTDLGKSFINKAYGGNNLLSSTGTYEAEDRHNKSNYWTLGASYVEGPVGVSVTYMNSKRMKNKFQNIAVGADYMAAPGFTPYIEVDFFNMKSIPSSATAYNFVNATQSQATDTSAGISQKNTGSVLFVGTKFNF